ncbi:MAG: hypothetical protein O6920_06060 [Chloroflexi bacterium]|nr:hypothetical protein [Chloroflexota bacterium]
MVFTITGQVCELESGIGVPNLKVEAWDRDLFFDDKLGERMTDPEGRFRISYTEEAFKDLFDKRPDIYLKVFAPSGVELHSTEQQVRCESGKEEHFGIDIPREVLGDLSRGRRLIPEVAVERAQFRSLILQNPNYFGNLELSPYKPVNALQGSTTFEELTCVGLNPPADRLEAVLHIKQESGYGGDICSFGTFEYVRFYVDLHDNGHWHDVGLTGVRVHDIPGDKPLCYAVRKDFSSFKKLCQLENIVRVRAILSWDNPPPFNQPNWTPVFGNVLNVQVQIHPKYSFFAVDLAKGLEELQIKIPDPIGPIIKMLDPNVKFKPSALETLSLAQKKEL